MPTRARIRGVVLELSELIPKLGYEVNEFVGPINAEGVELSEEEIDESADEETDYQYYITGEASGSVFYTMFSTSMEHAQTVYPLNILNHLSAYIDGDEVETLIEKPVEWGDISEEKEQNLYHDAVKCIIDNTDPEHYLQPAHTISAYGSTALVSYRQTTYDDWFPVEIQCDRGMFPYSEKLTLEYVDDRIVPVLIAGERARRYVQYSFYIDTEPDDPTEYEFRARF